MLRNLLTVDIKITVNIDPLRANPTKLSNTFKHFVRLAIEGLLDNVHEPRLGVTSSVLHSAH